MDTGTIAVLTAAAAAGAMMIFYRRRKRRLLSALYGTATGIGALMLVSCFGGYIGAEIPLNAFNVFGSALLGTPFVVLITVLRFI
ncbi:MAG: pro-sigmaK processing inhibitor BofA family protein [Ruminococcus sp.]|nr:pro-sigmaK processing inhibitor BofA family protein [Ruminococcus sp.]